MASRPIGELNGRWAFLLKLTLVLVPGLCGIFCAVAVPWVRWITATSYAAEDHLEEVVLMREELDTLDARIRQLPTAEWCDRIRMLEDQMRSNIEDHARIMISLEQIKGKLGVTNTPNTN